MEQRTIIAVAARRFRTPRATRRAFSLVELLAVLAVLSVLIFVVVPVTTSLQESAKLDYAGQVVLDQLAVARQVAASSNQTVYVRFIVPSSSTYKGYTALQLWRPDPSNPGQFVAVDRAIKLPDGMEISANATLSPLASILISGSSGTMPSGSNFPGTFVAFAIRPDGNVAITVPPSGVNVTTATNAAYQFLPSYFFTLLPVRYDGNSALPKNYVTIQINPDTAHAQMFRP